MLDRIHGSYNARSDCEGMDSARADRGTRVVIERRVEQPPEFDASVHVITPRKGSKRLSRSICTVSGRLRRDGRKIILRSPSVPAEIVEEWLENHSAK